MPSASGSPASVIPVLITTGKNPDRISKAIALAFCRAVPESRVEFRGKRTLASLVARAQKFRYTRLCAIHNESGKPSSIRFLEIADDGAWNWLAPAISITSAKPAGRMPKKSAQSRKLSVTGAKAKALLRLISPRNPVDEDVGSKINAGARSLSVFVGKKKILSLGVSYEK